MKNLSQDGLRERRLSRLLFINRLLRNGKYFCMCLFHIILATVIVYAIAIMKTFDTGRFGKLSFYPTRLFSEKGIEAIRGRNLKNMFSYNHLSLRV
jgi:hypothetical protein